MNKARRASLRKALAFHGGFLGDLSLNPFVTDSQT